MTEWVSMDSKTPFDTRCVILADFWLGYKNNPEFSDFIQYNDLGLPLAYALTTNIVKETDITERFINETFDLLLEAMGIQDDGFDSLDDLTLRYGS